MSWFGSRIIELETCASTNDEAARLARAGAQHGTIVIARAQTAGRGREGRAWASPPDTGLYFSAILRPALPLALVPPLTLAIGIGACDAVRAHGAPAVLKWPNDLLVAPAERVRDRPVTDPGRGGNDRPRKLGGVLVEAHSQGARLESVIVGIGINLAPLPPEHADVAETAISLAEAAAPRLVDRAAFIASLLAHVGTWIDRYVAAGLPLVIPAWHERMAKGLTARVTVDGEARTGIVTGLDADGSLLLCDEAGALHRVRSGDVQVVR